MGWNRRTVAGPARYRPLVPHTSTPTRRERDRSTAWPYPARGNRNDGVFVGCGYFADQLILDGRQLEATVAAFALARRIKANCQHHGVGTGRQLFCVGLNHLLGGHDAKRHARPSPLPGRRVFENYFVRTSTERQGGLRNQREGAVAPV